MPNIDDFEETPKHPNSRRDLEQRKADRLAGKLNPPIKGIRGLADVVAAMGGRTKHSLFCQCLDCIPMSLRPEFAPIPEGMETEQPAPTAAIPVGKSIYHPQKRKWTEQRGRSSN